MPEIKRYKSMIYRVGLADVVTHPLGKKRGGGNIFRIH